MKEFTVSALTKASLLTLAAACLPALAVAGPQDAYQLSAQALQDVSKNTDVTVTLKPNYGGIAPATLIKHVQMKSIDLTGSLRWTRNEMNVAARVNATGASSATKTYNDMARHQPVQVQLNVQTPSSTKTEVLRATTPVMLRPDLTVSEVRHDETVRAGQILNIAASIKELNADLGATTTVRLVQGETVLDQAVGVIVNKGGTSQAVFSTKFEQPGTYTMTVVAAAANPGDYDASNNSKTFTVKVVNDVQPSTYNLYYWHRAGTHGYAYSNWYYNNYSYEYTGEEQQFQHHIQSQPGVALAFPIAKASIQVNLDNGQFVYNKEVENLQQSYSYQYGCHTQNHGSSQLGDNIMLYVTSDTYCGSPTTTYAYVYQYAADYVNYSYNHDYYWGQQVTNVSTVKYGTMWRAKNTITSRLVITSSDGTAIGGTASMSLTATPQVYDYSYYYNERSWGNYVDVNGNAWGESQY